MTLEELQSEREAIRKRATHETAVLNNKYALENNQYNVGDIIEDHMGRGRILEIRTSIEFQSGIPVCVYVCENLLKNGEISKREPHRNIWQSNIK